MKKTILLSILINILACSSSDDNQNSSNSFTPPEKLISSMYVSSIDCGEGEVDLQQKVGHLVE